MDLFAIVATVKLLVPVLVLMLMALPAAVPDWVTLARLNVEVFVPEMFTAVPLVAPTVPVVMPSVPPLLAVKPVAPFVTMSRLANEVVLEVAL